MFVYVGSTNCSIFYLDQWGIVRHKMNDIGFNGRMQRKDIFNNVNT